MFATFVLGTFCGTSTVALFTGFENSIATALVDRLYGDGQWTGKRLV